MKTYLIDDQEYTAKAAHRIARLKGFGGSLGALTHRLHAGTNTWAELCRNRKVCSRHESKKCRRQREAEIRAAIESPYRLWARR